MGLSSLDTGIEYVSVRVILRSLTLVGQDCDTNNQNKASEDNAVMTC